MSRERWPQTGPDQTRPDRPRPARRPGRRRPQPLLAADGRSQRSYGAASVGVLRGRQTRPQPRPPLRTGPRPGSPGPSAARGGTIRPVARRPLSRLGPAPRRDRRGGYGPTRKHRATGLVRRTSRGTIRPGPCPLPRDGSGPYEAKLVAAREPRGAWGASASSPPSAARPGRSRSTISTAITASGRRAARRQPAGSTAISGPGRSFG